MRKGLLFWALIYLVSCTSNPKQTTSIADSTDTKTENQPTAKDTYFVLLSGTIDTYPIKMYLYALNHIYSGYYYYDSKQQPIYFRGEDSSVTNAILLSALANKPEPETFTFSFDGSKATGNWKMGGKTLPLSLSKSNMPVSFEYIGQKDSILASKTLSHSPKATAEASSVWPTGNSATDEFIKTQIGKLFTDKQSNTDISSILSNSVTSFLDDYRNDTTVNDKNIAESPERFNFESESDLRVAYLSPKLLSLSISGYSYTGGAHGNYGSTYLPLDIANNKMLSLPDILTPDGIKQLRPLLEKSYRRDKNLQPSQPLTDGWLFENKIEPNKNYFVTGKGLIFDYNPYEIASYADGEIQIMITYSDLQAYLQPSFKSLLP